MRTLPIEVVNILNSRGGIKVRNLYWIRAKNRSTGAEETIGVWNGEDTRVFTVEGQTRTYIGGGGFLSIGNIKNQIGLNIQQLMVTANAVSPEFITAMREYDPKGARVEIHLLFFDTDTDQVVSDPYRAFKGWLNTAPVKTGAKNDSSVINLNHVGHARILTRLTPSKRSDENQRRRSGSDRFFRYVGITGTVQTSWGSQ